MRISNPFTQPAQYDFSNVPELPSPVKNQLMAMEMFIGQGGTWEDWKALRELWERESEWSAISANEGSSAFGIPQGLTKTHGLRDTDYMVSPKAQIEWGLNYINEKYGTPKQALAHHDREGWY